MSFYLSSLANEERYNLPWVLRGAGRLRLVRWAASIHVGMQFQCPVGKDLKAMPAEGSEPVAYATGREARALADFVVRQTIIPGQQSPRTARNHLALMR
jgi:hypothetical protein